MNPIDEAAPSPAEGAAVDERSQFETWIQKTSGWKACKLRGKPMYLRKNADGSYNDFRVNDRWGAFKAGADVKASLTHAAPLLAEGDV